MEFKMSVHATAERPTAVVTGASGGIGKAIAIDLIDNGWNVCMIARSYEKMEQIANNYKSNEYNRIKIIKCDVTDLSQILSTCKEIKLWSNNNVNLLLNNAGGFAKLFSNLERTSTRVWESDINLNLRAPFLFTQKLLPSLKFASKNVCKLNGNIYDGSIINISSALSTDASAYTQSMTYSVAKAGLNQLTRLNAMELGKYKVRVNALTLGTILSDMVKNFLSDQSVIDSLFKKFAKVHPIGRTGTYSDVSNMVKFLSKKDQSGWITGAIIDLNGGWNLLNGGLKSFSKL